LEALRQRVDDTFNWYNTLPKELPKHMAPYFPVIQSSGMGKTKLLYELRKELNENSDTHCHLCLPGKVETSPGFDKPKENVDGVYSSVLDLDKIVEQFKDSLDSASEVGEKVMQTLDKKFPRPSEPKNDWSYCLMKLKFF
jgi:hypothetical protein